MVYHQPHKAFYYDKELNRLEAEKALCEVCPAVATIPQMSIKCPFLLPSMVQAPQSLSIEPNQQECTQP